MLFSSINEHLNVIRDRLTVRLIFGPISKMYIVECTYIVQHYYTNARVAYDHGTYFVLIYIFKVFFILFYLSYDSFV